MKNLKETNYKNMSLTDAINLMIDNSEIAHKAIAADIGKPLSTFQRELNAYDDGAKIGVETLYPLIRACCGDNPKEPPAPLMWLCHRLGFEPVPFGYEEPNGKTVEIECLESVQAVTKAHSAILNNEDPEEVKALIAKAKIDLDQDSTIYEREYNKNLKK